jgi:hypothetical protein
MKREWHSRIWTTIAARAGVAALIAVLTASVLAAHAEAGEPLTTASVCVSIGQSRRDALPRNSGTKLKPSGSPTVFGSNGSMRGPRNQERAECQST